MEKISVRLYNKAKAKEVPMYRSADVYGFEDLILVPVVELGKIGDTIVSAKITPELLWELNLSENEVYSLGINNLEVEIEGLNKLMAKFMRRDGMPEELIEMMLSEEEMMYVVSNPDRICGAAAIIAAREKLKKKFPNGYVCIPSSIHEMLIIPITNYTKDINYLEYVKYVNGEVLDPEDWLADNVYEFKA